jgi:DNA-binding CsgD family transcriptional regulator
VNSHRGNLKINTEFTSTLTKVVLGLASVFFMYDLISDIVEGESWPHLILEACVFILVTAAFAWEITSRSRLSRALDNREQVLSRMQGRLGDSIREQLAKWKLTPSETEVAWLIIKGYSFSEIASLREVKEKTVRQQATSIYSKSGTRSRAEFSASFLEDLLSVSSASPVA